MLILEAGKEPWLKTLILKSTFWKGYTLSSSSSAKSVCNAKSKRSTRTLALQVAELPQSSVTVSVTVLSPSLSLQLKSI